MRHNQLVSILIPIYNSQKTLKSALNCAINQSYRNIEILASDNCSTDNTSKIYKQKKYRMVKVFKQKKNIGGIRNYNFLINKSKGKYFVLMHSDDNMSKNYVENCLKKMILDKGNSIVIGKMFHKNLHIYDKNKLSNSKKFLRLLNFCKFYYSDILINGLIKKNKTKNFNLNFISCETPFLFELISNGKLQYVSNCFYKKSSDPKGRPINDLYSWYFVKKNFWSRYGYFFESLGIFFKKNSLLKGLIIALIFSLYNLPILRILFKKRKP